MPRRYHPLRFCLSLAQHTFYTGLTTLRGQTRADAHPFIEIIEMSKTRNNSSYFDPHVSLLDLPIVRWTLGIIVFSSALCAIEIGWLEGRPILLNAEGFNNVLEVFKVPIGILATLIPAVALLAANHRSEQAKEQMRLAAAQNIFANHYKHLEEFEDYCESRLDHIEKINARNIESYAKSALKGLAKDLPLPGHVDPYERRVLYRKIFPKSRKGDFEISGDFIFSIDHFIQSIFDRFALLGISYEEQREEKVAELYDLVHDFIDCNNVIVGSTRPSKFSFENKTRELPFGSVGGILYQFEQAITALDETLHFDIDYQPSTNIKIAKNFSSHIIGSDPRYSEIGKLSQIINPTLGWRWKLKSEVLLTEDVQQVINVAVERPSNLFYDESDDV